MVLLSFEDPLETRHYINGSFVPSINGKKIITINPATEELIAEVHAADEDDVNVAVESARQAFKPGSPWREMDATGRRDCMLKLADAMEKNRSYLAKLESMNNGKPEHIADAADLGLSIKCMRYYAGWADKIMGKTIPIDGSFFCYTQREPVGVVGQIIPWNFPILMMIWKLGPSLASGCTVVLKTSEKTPLTALAICKLVEEAGFPKGVINVLSGFGPTAGQPLACHPHIDKIAFTGSTATARMIQKCAIESNLKRVTLELGGKSPHIIFDDADLDQAVNDVQHGLFFNQGECCIAGSRIFVHKDIYAEFVKKLLEVQAGIKVGSPTSAETGLGPLVDKIQFDRVMDYIESGKKSAESGKCKLACGGSRLGDQGYFVQPTVFTDVDPSCKIAQEEIFGPVMAVMKPFSSIEEVLEMANSTKYGLGAGVSTRDVGKALKVASGLRAGTVYVNCYNVFDAAAPFGGFKESGLGRELGECGIDAYTENKTVIIPIDRS